MWSYREADEHPRAWSPVVLFPACPTALILSCMREKQKVVHLGEQFSGCELISERFPDRATRYAVDDVIARLGLFEAAAVINISLTGVALQTQKYLAVGKDYPLRVDGESGALCLNGTVVWCRLIRTKPIGHGEVVPIYRAGIKFSALTTRKSRELRRFVDAARDLAEPLEPIAAASSA